MRLERIELSSRVWKTRVMAIIRQPLNTYMGNQYNMEQKVDPKAVMQAGGDASKVGLDSWKTEMRRQLMEKLRQYSPEHIDKIMKATFGDLDQVQ